MFDVAVVGAGPSGAMTARLLAEQGLAVLLLEEHPQPGHPVNCSGIIGVEAFQRYDLPKETIIRSIRQFRFFSPGGAILSYEHPEPLAYAVHRSQFDRKLAARAVSAGAELRTGSRVTDIGIHRHGVKLEINHKEKIRVPLVVIATGAGSRLTERVGLGRPSRNLLGVQTEIAMTGLEEVEIHLGHRITPSNFAWIIPLEKDRAKVGLLADENGKQALKNFLSLLQDRVQTQQPVIQCSLLPLETLPRTYTDRTIVVGEAAGQIKTITCGGIYYGLLAGEIAAEVIGESLRGNRWDAAALAVYHQRWTRLLGRELQIGLRLRRLFERFSDDRIDALFDLARKDGLMTLIRDKANFDWHYELVRSVFRHSLVRGFLHPVLYSSLVV